MANKIQILLYYYYKMVVSFGKVMDLRKIGMLSVIYTHNMFVCIYTI